jgi:drug/metabolite transporter (DMT)-like permease
MKQMKKENLPLILIIASIILIILSFIFTSEEMGLGFWLGIASSVLVILAMFLTIRHQKKEGKTNLIEKNAD